MDRRLPGKPGRRFAIAGTRNVRRRRRTSAQAADVLRRRHAADAAELARKVLLAGKAHLPGHRAHGEAAAAQEGFGLLHADLCDVLARRKAKWGCPEPKIKTGYLARYAKMVSSADKGAILE